MHVIGFKTRNAQKIDWDHNISNNGICQTRSPRTPRVNASLVHKFIHDTGPIGILASTAF